MKLQIAASIVAVSLVGGVSTGLVAHQMRSGDDPKPKSDPTVTATKTPTKTSPTKATTTAAPKPPKATKTPLVPLMSMQIVAGAVGPVQVGMTKQAAARTGYLDVDVPYPACGYVRDLWWKAPYRNTLDLYTDNSGTLLSIGVAKSGPHTRSGLQVGSTYERVQEVLGDVEPEEAGYGQTGLFVSEGTGWIGFLFDATPATIKATDKVTFIEVTRGTKPGLIRDGC
jgi:hypothetical protein